MIGGADASDSIRLVPQSDLLISTLVLSLVQRPIREVQDFLGQGILRRGDSDADRHIQLITLVYKPMLRNSILNSLSRLSNRRQRCRS